MLANCTRSAKTGYFATMVNDLLESAEKKLEEKIKMSKKKEMYWFWAYPLAVFRVSVAIEFEGWPLDGRLAIESWHNRCLVNCAVNYSKTDETDEMTGTEVN